MSKNRESNKTYRCTAVMLYMRYKMSSNQLINFSVNVLLLSKTLTHSILQNIKHDLQIYTANLLYNIQI